VQKKRIGNISLDQKTYKLATVLTFTCKYGHVFTVSPEKVDESKPASCENFKINFCFILAMQVLGKGLRTMCAFLGLLGIRSTEGNYKIWKRIQDKVGESQQRLAEQCCSENLRKEVEATIASGILPMDDGRVPIAASGDTGWQGNGSRMTYNSQSGQTTLCGGLTKKVVAYKYFSKLCRTCQIHSNKDPDSTQPPPKHRCPKNWSESSKSMEPHGILECVKSIWRSGIAWVNTFISDDDSSSRAALKHPILTQIAKGYINKWPLDKNNKEVKCTGRLPDDIHAVSTFLVDPSHRRRVVGSQQFKIEKTVKGMKKSDCECYIRNFGYAVKQNRHKSFEEFETAMKAVLEHHFDNHEFCSPVWCHFREDSHRKSDDTTRAKLRNLSVEENKVVYIEMKKIHDAATTRENLLMLLHGYDSQKNEALNRAFTKLAPKNIVFSKTFSLFDRLSFVIIIDSVGYAEGLRRLLADIFEDEDNDPGPVLLGWANREDIFKQYILKRQQTKKEKIRRTKEKKIRLSKQRANDRRAKRRGDRYGRGVAILPEEDEDNVAETGVRVSRTQRQRPSPTQCKCGRTDHVRISFNDCELNPKNIARRKAEEEEAARKQAEAAENTTAENAEENNEVVIAEEERSV